jgi:copper chaperone CopZ
VSVAIKKIPGVEFVEVSLNQGKAMVRLRPGNTARLEDLVQRVRENGFTPKEAKVLVYGELVAATDKLQLKVQGLSQTFDLALDPKAAPSGELRRQVGRVLAVEGVIPIPQAKSAPHVIQLQQWKVAPR